MYVLAVRMVNSSIIIWFACWRNLRSSLNVLRAFSYSGKQIPKCVIVHGPKNWPLVTCIEFLHLRCRKQLVSIYFVQFYLQLKARDKLNIWYGIPNRKCKYLMWRHGIILFWRWGTIALLPSRNWEINWLADQTRMKISTDKISDLMRL